MSDLSLSPQIKEESPAYQVAKRFVKNGAAVTGMAVIVLLVICALFAPVIAPYGYDDQNLSKQFIPPSREHIFGTDDFGRDIFSRVVYGSRISLIIGASSVALAAVAGIFLGCLAGYYHGCDNLIMRIMDVFMAIPGILLAISIVAMLGVGFQNLIIAIGFSSIPSHARLVRSAVLSIKEKEYIEAAISNGSGSRQIIFRHILPNCLSIIVVKVTTDIAGAILAASSLSFIGLGVVAPTPEWGAMLSSGRAFFREHWFVVMFPGLAIMITVLAFNPFGNGLRDALDPKLK